MSGCQKIFIAASVCPADLYVKCAACAVSLLAERA